MSRGCEARRHLKIDEFGLYQFILQLCFRSGCLYADAEYIAKEFGSTSRYTVYRLLKKLTKKGWLKLKKAGKRKPNGTYFPSEYEIVTHAQWVTTHPGECPATVEPVSKSQPGSAKNASDLLAKPAMDQLRNLVSPVVKPQMDQLRNRNVGLDKSNLEESENDRGRESQKRVFENKQIDDDIEDIFEPIRGKPTVNYQTEMINEQKARLLQWEAKRQRKLGQ